jgi:hypothetical protein
MKKIRKKVNLRKEYDRLNKLLFEDQLPNAILRWSRTKRRYGLAQIKTGSREYWTNNKGEKKVTITCKFIISIAYKTIPTYNRFLATLAHEMLHVYFWAVEADSCQGHGSRFQQKARELSFILSSEHQTGILLGDGQGGGKEGLMLRQLIWCQDNDHLYYK